MPQSKETKWLTIYHSGKCSISKALVLQQTILKDAINEWRELVMLINLPRKRLPTKFTGRAHQRFIYEVTTEYKTTSNEQYSWINNKKDISKSAKEKTQCWTKRLFLCETHVPSHPNTWLQFLILRVAQSVTRFRWQFLFYIGQVGFGWLFPLNT